VPKNKLPPEVIKHWPEVLSDVEIKAVPIEYIDSMRVHFHDGKIWEIDLDKQKMVAEGNVETIEHSLETFLAEYDNEINHVDFRLNSSKLVKDVKSRTQKFMKKRK
jgi:hypothetical protein